MNHWTDKQRERWQGWIEWLHDEFPVSYRVHVWRVPYRKLFGSATHNGEEAWIKIAKRLTFAESLYALYEEWAHLREWHDEDEHGPAWAAEYGEIIRAAERREEE